MISRASGSSKLVTFDIVVESRSAMAVMLVEGPARITVVLHAVINKKK